MKNYGSTHTHTHLGRVLLADESRRCAERLRHTRERQRDARRSVGVQSGQSRLGSRSAKGMCDSLSKQKENQSKTKQAKSEGDETVRLFVVRRIEADFERWFERTD